MGEQVFSSLTQLLCINPNISAQHPSPAQKAHVAGCVLWRHCAKWSLKIPGMDTHELTCPLAYRDIGPFLLVLSCRSILSWVPQRVRLTGVIWGQHGISTLVKLAGLFFSFFFFVYRVEDSRDGRMDSSLIDKYIHTMTQLFQRRPKRANDKKAKTKKREYWWLKHAKPGQKKNKKS